MQRSCLSHQVTVDKDHPRYNTVHTWGNVEFTLSFMIPHEDECREFLMEMIEQAVRDYVNLKDSPAPIEQLYHITAAAMIFDDDYRVDYGGQLMSFQDILDVFDVDAEWFRERTLRKLKDHSKKRKRKKDE